MSLNQKLKSELSDALQKHIGSPAPISSVQSVGGGSINDAYRIAAGGQLFFVKVNAANRYPQMLAKEAKGLRFIAENSHFKVPKVFEVGRTGDLQFIAMEFIQSTAEAPDYWEQFGAELARMHRYSADHFGLDYDNYMGSMVQLNKRSEKWADFFVEQRLLPQIKAARDAGKADQAMVRGFDLLFSRAENLFPVEPPAAVHGDLWSGNFMTGADGHATIFDPAVYFGHREVDIAMTRLFGGFDSGFYRGYLAEYPLESGWEERVDIANLYPLMVHVNLFGGGYAAQVKSVLARFH
ncbi:MAG: fructosamine kinase family protein [Cryomorphaceae bacterium]|nr:fructosamine kinase family protein [Flavobacteriales bacterium]